MRKTGKDIRSEYEIERAKERKEYGGYDKYEVEEWARSVEKAAEIMNDPKKMAAVSKCLKKKVDSMENVKAFMKSGDQGK